MRIHRRKLPRLHGLAEKQLFRWDIIDVDAPSAHRRRGSSHWIKTSFKARQLIVEGDYVLCNPDEYVRVVERTPARGSKRLLRTARELLTLARSLVTREWLLDSAVRDQISEAAATLLKCAYDGFVCAAGFKDLLDSGLRIDVLTANALARLGFSFHWALKCAGFDVEPRRNRLTGIGNPLPGLWEKHGFPAVFKFKARRAAK
jgi:hypothetical protein